MRKLILKNLMILTICFTILPLLFKSDIASHDCETSDTPCTGQGTCTDFGYCICDDGFSGFDCSTSKIKLFY